jgi:hypothetical protein
MCAVNQSVGMKGFEVLPNRNLRGCELLGKFSDKDSPLTVQQIENSAAAFFV